MSSDSVINRFSESLEGIPRMIVTALTKRGENIKARAEKTIDEIVEAFDFEAVVHRVAEPLLHAALEKAVENHFQSKSGQQAINDHIEKIFSKTKVTPVATEKSEPTPVETPAPKYFSDPLPLANIEDLLKQEDRFIEIPNFTPLSLSQALTDKGSDLMLHDHALVVTAADAEALRSEAFLSFFDQNYDKAQLEAGQIGTLYGMEVYSDAFLDVPKRFITVSGILKSLWNYNIPRQPMRR